jgi:hypothetical protein
VANLIDQFVAEKRAVRGEVDLHPGVGQDRYQVGKPGMKRRFMARPDDGPPTGELGRQRSRNRVNIDGGLREFDFVGDVAHDAAEIAIMYRLDLDDLGQVSAYW